MQQKQKLLSLAEKLAALPPQRVKALIGFDGFVDEIVHVVDKRIGVEEYVRLTSMAEYGRRIQRSAGLSTNVEMVTLTQKLGGNGPVFANTLIQYGYDITYIGAVGAPDIHPVFAEMATRCRMISVAGPAWTDAIEFFDGKIISSKLEPLKEVNWNSLCEKIGVEKLAGLLEGCELVGFENWTMLHHMSEIWERMLTEVHPRLSKRAAKPTIFFDLADPEKREAGDVLRALELIGRFGAHYKTVLGLNHKEALEIAEILGMSDQDASLEALARYLFSHLRVDTLVIHPVKRSCVITEDGYFEARGPYCECPKLTTGAGDNFNAGFVFGAIAGLTMEQTLLAGMATSGYYVRNAATPNRRQLVGFLSDWALGRLDQ